METVAEQLINHDQTFEDIQKDVDLVENGEMTQDQFKNKWVKLTNEQSLNVLIDWRGVITSKD